MALTAHNGRFAWEHAPEGIWPIDTYLGMLSGEVTRLTDNEQGYGPRGQDFLVHVDAPQEVSHAAATLIGHSAHGHIS